LDDKKFKIDIAGEGWLRVEFHSFPENAEAQWSRKLFCIAGSCMESLGLEELSFGGEFFFSRRI